MTSSQRWRVNVVFVDFQRYCEHWWETGINRWECGMNSIWMNRLPLLSQFRQKSQNDISLTKKVTK